MTHDERRRYGDWAGNPGGTPEDPARCIQAVAPIYWRSRQCKRRRGYGPNGEYCKQHARMIAEGRHVYVPDPR